MSSVRIFVSCVVFGALAIAWAGAVAAQVVIVGTGDPAVDVPAVQAAVDRGGDVILEGHFSFDGAPTIVPELPGFALATVRISREVTISGTEDGDGEVTTIEGGQVPFEVEGHGSSVTIQRLHFVHPRIEAIDVSAVSGLNVRSCRIEGVEPVSGFGATAIGINTTFNPPTPSSPGAPERISGKLSIVDNEIDLAGSTGAFNTIGILIFSAGIAGAEIDAHILGNRISNSTEPAINFRRVVGHVAVEWNKISTANMTGPARGAAEAIRVVNSGSYRIAQNSIDCRWPQGFAIGVFSQFAAWPVERAVVAGNEITMSPPEGTVFGQNSAAISVRGFARGNLVFANTIRGRARNAMSIITFPPPPAVTGVPADNAFLLNRLDDFLASAADIFVGEHVLNTLVIGEGSVEDHGVGTVIVPLPQEAEQERSACARSRKGDP
jgi:hypothetical protein